MYELYTILNLSYPSNSKDIKKSFIKLAKIYHPDKFEGDDVMFKKVRDAFDILSNIEKKKIYDKKQYNLQNEKYLKVAEYIFQYSFSYFIYNLK